MGVLCITPTCEYSGIYGDGDGEKIRYELTLFSPSALRITLHASSQPDPSLPPHLRSWILPYGGQSPAYDEPRDGPREFIITSFVATKKEVL